MALTPALFRPWNDIQPMVLDVPPIEPPGEVIIVTGKALPDAAAERAYHVDILSRRQLAGSPAHALDELLTGQPGVQLFRRSDSTSGHPTSQGVTLRALGGNAASRALLVLDGVPQADPFGGWVNWPAYDAAGLEEVRILRGGGSVAHGPGALAGVIDLRSRTEAAVHALAEAGSRESFRGHLYAGVAAGAGLATLDAKAARSDGFIPVTRATRGPADRAAPYREASVRTRWVTPLGDRLEMQLGGLAFVDERERGLHFTGNETRGADASVRLVSRGRWQWSALGYAQWRQFDSSFASVSDGRLQSSRVSLQHVPSHGLGGSVEVRPPTAALDLRFGADFRLATGESHERYAYVAADPTRWRVAGGKSATAGLFAEASIKRGPLAFSAGARIDHWRIGDGQLVEGLLAGGAPTRDESFGSRNGWLPTARVGAVVEIARNANLRLAAYRGWRLPTLNELFRPFRAGADATAANALLEPEANSGAEAGIDYQRGPVDLAVSIFVNRLSNPIANVTLGHGPGLFPGVGFVAGNYRQRQNLDAVTVSGIEASFRAVTGPWSARIGASLADARVAADGSAAALDGLRPAQTPRLMLAGELGWESQGRFASLAVRHVGSQYEDDLNAKRLPAATTVDAILGWPLTNRLRLVARGENLLNETVVAGIGEDGAVERATPRTIWLGLRFGSW